jgi:hypothetical protein
VLEQLLTELEAKLHTKKCVRKFAAFELSIADIETGAISNAAILYIKKRLVKLKGLINNDGVVSNPEVFKILYNSTLLETICQINVFILRNGSLLDEFFQVILLIMQDPMLRENCVKKMLSANGVVLPLIACKLYIEFPHIYTQALKLFTFMVECVDQEEIIRSLSRESQKDFFGCNSIDCASPSHEQKENEPIKEIIHEVLIHSAPTTIARLFIANTNSSSLLSDKLTCINQCITCLQFILKYTESTIYEKIVTFHSGAVIQTIIINIGNNIQKKKECINLFGKIRWKVVCLLQFTILLLQIFLHIRTINLLM